LIYLPDKAIEEHYMSKAKSPKDEINVGAGGEWHQTAGGKHPPLTTNQGLVIADNQNSLKANPNGPTLQDEVFQQRRAIRIGFQRIPVRGDHTRATGA